MQIEALLDRSDFALRAGLTDVEFQHYANAGLIPACLGFYNGQPLWNRTSIAQFCAQHNLPALPAATPETPTVVASTPPPQVDQPADSTPPAREMMTVEQVCTRLKTSPATLQKRRQQGLLPEYEMRGKRNIMYFADSVNAIYDEYGKLPRVMSADGIAACKANAEKARAKLGAKKKPFVYMAGEPAKPLLEPKPAEHVGEKRIVNNAGMDESEAAAHLGIDLLMLRILRKAGIGPDVAQTTPEVGYSMRDLNMYSQKNGLSHGQIARPDKTYLDKMVRITEAAQITHLTPKALEHHRAKGTGPSWDRQGIFSVYKRGDLYAWLVHKDELAEAAALQQRARAH